MPHRNPSSPVAARGVTLVELMITVAVAAILAAIALPSFQSSIRANRLATATNQIIAAVTLARSEAVRNTRGSGVCGSADGTTCGTGGDWTPGWLVWSDVNGNGTYDAGTDTALRFMQGNPKLTVAGPASAATVRFDARGRLVGNAAADLVLQPDACGSRNLRRTVRINITGQVRKAGDAACQ